MSTSVLGIVVLLLLHGCMGGGDNAGPTGHQGASAPNGNDLQVTHGHTGGNDTIIEDCTGAANHTACDDGNACTIQDTCQAGVCAGTALPGPCRANLAVVPLSGSSFTLYALQAQIGAQGPFTLVIDTGSSFLAVASSTCTDCAGRVPTYTSSMPLSTSMQSVGPYGCGEGFQGERTTGFTGVLAQDTVTLANQTIPLTFQAITGGTAAGYDIPMFTCLDNGFSNAGQGIIGLQSGPFEGAGSFADAFAQTKVVPDVIAMQLCDRDGRLWFGGYDPNFVSGPPVFTPFTNAYSYAVALTDITVGGKSIGVTQRDFGSSEVDSGTSRFTLPSTAYMALRNAIAADGNFKALFGASFLDGNACSAPAQALTQQQLDATLPRMTLVFAGVAGASPVTLDLPATESYLTPNTTRSPAGGYCPGIEQELSGFTSNLTLIGNTVMHTSVTIFDRVHGQLGFAPQAHCDTATQAALATH